MDKDYNRSPQEVLDELHTSAQGLTPEEKQEQLALRREYIDSVVGNLARELDNTYVVEPNGEKHKLQRNENKGD